MNGQLCIQIIKTEGGSDLSEHLYPVFTCDDKNDSIGYDNKNYAKFITRKKYDPQPAFLEAIRKHLKENLLIKLLISKFTPDSETI